MWPYLQKILDRLESRLSLILIIAGTGIFSGITTYLASGVAALSEKLGYFGLWLFFSVCILLCFSAFALFAWAQSRLAMANATRKWTTEVDFINPLNSEFSRKRINITKMPHPSINTLMKKKFIECEIIGPAAVFLGNNTTLLSTTFIDCDFAVTKLRPHLSNAIILQDVTILGGSISGVIFFIHPAGLHVLDKDIRPRYATLTGDPEIDARE